MLFMAVGRVSEEGLRGDAGTPRPAAGLKRLAEYVVPGSLRFFGIYQAESLTALSQYLRRHPALQLDSVEPILHLENVMILESAAPSEPGPDGDLSL